MMNSYRSSLSPISRISRQSYNISKNQLYSFTNKNTKRVFHSTPKSSSVTPPTPTTSGQNAILSFPKTNPFAFQLMVATTKTSVADVLVQVVAEKKKWNEIDWRRNGIFVVFGFAYLGCFQWFLMVNKYRQWFPTMDRFAKLSFAAKLKDTAGLIDAAKMVVFDVCIHMPMMYFPSYYFAKELVVGNSFNPIDWAKDGLTKYKTNMKDDLTAMIKLWGPSDCVQFVLPLHIRMPFRHLVSFFWTAYVSFTRGSIDEVEVDQSAVIKTAA